MIEEPNKVDLREVLALYEGRISHIENPDTRSPLELGQARSRFIQRVERACIDLLYGSIIEDKEGPHYTNHYSLWVVDESVPLYLLGIRAISREPGYNHQKVSFYMFNTPLDLTNTSYLRKLNMGAADNDPACIAEFAFVRTKGHSYGLEHRIVRPAYRDQGLGSVLMAGSEAFFNALGDHEGQALSITVNAGQLGLMCWLYNCGYRPKSKADKLRFESILDGDASYCIGEAQYVFPKTVPESKRTINEAFHGAQYVQFIKEIHQDDQVFREIALHSFFVEGVIAT